ncbi:Sensor protein FixL [Rubripirellula lacrimiformis]|uniref:histidine kinase n=1 Tax=Rubripirellula lacrimiformis TaxID=1930273 RepID=A0A517N4R1_9BACT|nr:ATP-binding protein [Rubripirellula lacrimiformis]QDT02125.1 Sensor protein FixL [Rubripirellula lacrimiformis]
MLKKIETFDSYNRQNANSVPKNVWNFSAPMQIWHSLCIRSGNARKRSPMARFNMQTNTNPLRRNRLADLLMQTSPAAIVLTDSRGIIEAMNDVGEQSFGYQETELLGQPIDLIFPGDSSSADASHCACILSQLGDPDPSKILFLGARRKDGSTLPTQVTLHALTTPSGESRLANVIDLTDETQHPAAARRCISNHEKRIQGERLAAVLQMVSGLAHESRNALQRAQSCLDLLQLDLVGKSDLLDLTDRIGDALKDIHRNYEEVKNYAAPITLVRTTVDLGQICQDAFAELIESLGTDVPRLAVQSNNRCQDVKLDADRIRSVLRHLLENAIQASPADSVIEFEFDCTGTSDEGELQIRVRDHGEGLTAEVETRMFEPFFTTKTKGTGLGLAVCRRIVEAHRGSIQAVNHCGGGTQVTIRIPRGRVP